MPPTRTNAYIALKSQAQSLFDFTVMVCYAVPALKGYIKAVEHGTAEKLPDADYFRAEPGRPIPGGRLTPAAVREKTTAYRQRLGSLVLLGTFSYFESYIKSVAAELLDFHGGGDQLSRVAADRARANQTLKGAAAERIRHLRKPYQPEFRDRYRHALSALRSEHRFSMPSEWLASFGVRQLVSQLSVMRAVEIPDLLRLAFLFPMSDGEVEEFHRIRDKRNSVAHADKDTFDLSEAIEANTFLADLADRFDRHLTTHFFIREVDDR
jgi:hypothetical protein